MQAILIHKYGSPDDLELEEIETPRVGDDGVLVRVRAASVNPYDWHLMRGEPFLVRLLSGLRRPRTSRMGVDVAGHVEAVGRDVTDLRPGDDVFGACSGAFAEYARGTAKSLVRKPANVTFEQAAAVNIAGHTALQALRDRGRLQPGQRVLINGAAGGVGTFAVQIAKALGAHVTGVCSGRNVDMVRSIGADQVIDYTRDDFTRNGQRYDLILNVAGNSSLSDCRRAMAANGTLVLVGGSGKAGMVPILAGMLAAVVRSRFSSKKLLPFLAKASHADLIALKEMIEAGKVTPVIDRTYPLSRTPDAIRYLEDGHARGKVVVVV